MEHEPTSDKGEIFDCPQCGHETPEDQFQEGYCNHCYADNQRALDEHNASFDRWERMADGEREDEIKMFARKEMQI